MRVHALVVSVRPSVTNSLGRLNPGEPLATCLYLVCWIIRAMVVSIAGSSSDAADRLGQSAARHSMKHVVSARFDAPPASRLESYALKRYDNYRLNVLQIIKRST